MTNKDRFLREGISVEEFAKEFEEFCEAMIEENIVMTYEQEIEEFLKCEFKPPLTEDERVILKNLKKDYITLVRGKMGILFIAKERDENGVRETNYLEFKDNLFQFIKNGEEYEIKELLK